MRDLRERATLAGQLGVQLGHRLLAAGIDEERGHVVRELVARRPLDRPVARSVLARLEDLLDPDVGDTALAQPLEVLARIREPVGMVDAQPVDEAVADELEDLRVRDLEDLRVLDAHAGELVDVEEAAVPAGRRIEVEERRAQLRVATRSGFSSEVAMWFGTMSRITPSPAACAASQSARSSASPPSSSETRVGSTTS